MPARTTRVWHNRSNSRLATRKNWHKRHSHHRHTLGKNRPVTTHFLLSIVMIKKGVFEWIRTGQKTIELRRGGGKYALWRMFVESLWRMSLFKLTWFPQTFMCATSESMEPCSRQPFCGPDTHFFSRKFRRFRFNAFRFKQIQPLREPPIIDFTHRTVNA